MPPLLLEPANPDLDDPQPGSDDHDDSLLTHDGDASEGTLPDDDDGPGIVPPAPD